MKVEQIIKLPKEIEAKMNEGLVAQAKRVYEDRIHLGLAKVKTRSEISRTKKKWYRQKGTGGARHGARSAHIFVGGGVVHGPTGVKKLLRFPSKMKKLALNMVLTKIAKEKRLFVIKEVNKVKKTKDAAKLVEDIRLVLLADKNSQVLKYFRNLKSASVKLFKDLNVLDLIKSSKVLIDADVFETRKGKAK